MKNLIEVKNLVKHYPVRRGLFARTQWLRAVDDVSFSIQTGEMVGLVGESGSGKTTVGRTLLRLVEPTSGSIHFDGQDVRKAGTREMRSLRRKMQMIFQDPYASLNPKQRVLDQVLDGLTIHGMGTASERLERAQAMLSRVGIRADQFQRWPHEFSGGQRQRIGIARALALSPSLIVADEAVSALDVSVQAQVINLLQDLRAEMNLTILFVSHDLSVVGYVCDRVIVMYLGKIVEDGPVETVYNTPAHPYTKALLAANPSPDPKATVNSRRLEGEIPSPITPPSGCVFRTRCPHAISDCAQTEPPLRRIGNGQHSAACIRLEAL